MSTASLGGKHLLALDHVGWVLRPGISPYVRTFELPRDDARELARDFGPYELIIAGARFQGVYVVGTSPGSTPHTLSVVAADCRVWWKRRIVFRSYNMRRRSGDTRLVGEGLLQQKALVADLTYKAWSLNGSAPWTAKEALGNVLFQLEGQNYRIRDKVTRQLDVQDLELRDSGDIALGKVLQYVVGWSVYVDRNGVVIAYDTRSGGEGEVVGAAGPPLVSSGMISVSDNSLVRPRSVIVYFEAEPEVRFDYTEPTGTGTSSTPSTSSRSSSSGREPRELENVLPCPDPTLVVGGRTVTAGTWITFDEAFTAWSGSEPATAPGPLSHFILRTWYFRTFHYLRFRYTGLSTGVLDAVWMRRIEAVRRHWRQTFRISRHWMDKVESVRAYRVGIVDEETGVRAPAQAYMDYLVKPSFKALTPNYVTRQARMGYAFRGYNATLADAVMAPAVVQILDQDNGIVDIRLAPDPFGETETMAPGYVKEEDLPQESPRDLGKLFWAGVSLENDFAIATVLTCVKGSPNNRFRLHQVEIEKAEAETTLGRSVGDCRGPSWHVLVESSPTTTARFAWSDNRRTEIEDAFFTTGASNLPEDLLVNGNDINVMARAAAARVYSGLLDLPMGRSAYALNPDLEIQGSVGAVSHTLSPQGHQTTSLEFPPVMRPLDLWAFVPASQRRKLLRLTQP